MVRGNYCGLGPHPVDSDSVFITDPRHIAFIRKRQKEFRPQDDVCRRCRNTIEHVYNLKYQRAKSNRRRHSMNVSSTTTSTSEDSLENRRAQTARRGRGRGRGGRPRPASVVPQGNRSTSTEVSVTDDSSDVTVISSQTVYKLASPQNSDMPPITSSEETMPPPGHSPRHAEVNVSSTSSLDTQPSTSAAAAAKRRAVHFDPVIEEVDDDFEPSPNALNGTRRPDIQPIPKRRQFVSLNKDVMDIYLAGTTGG